MSSSESAQTNIRRRISTALAGRYTVERELGRGGMAVVYLAHDETHQRQVAIKVMRPEAVGDVGHERFRREIAIAARLTHPNIVTVLDAGEADKLFFYVMPFIEGESVDDAILRAGQLEIAEAVSIARQIAHALHYAHAEGVVHRDIKPANILLTRSRHSAGADGEEGDRIPLVTDFGIARAIAGEGQRLTETGLLVGTPTYMSPEQATGERELDGRSDQYSLACMLYEMLMGEPPFTGPTVLVVLARHTEEMAPSMRIVRPTIPEGLELAIFRAMSKAPASRFHSMAEFGDAIAAAAEGPIMSTTAEYAAPKVSTTPARLRNVRPVAGDQPAQQLMATSLVDTRAPTRAFQVPRPRRDDAAKGDVSGRTLARWARAAVEWVTGKHRRLTRTFRK